MSGDDTRCADDGAETRPSGRAARSELRRQALLDAAMAVFLERGYAGATVDAVIERAGGSKETVYAYFGSKAGLFTALVTHSVQSLELSVDAADTGTDLAGLLRDLAERYLTLVTSPRTVGLNRLVMAEVRSLPELGDLFFKAGPANLTDWLAGRLAGFLPETAGNARDLAAAFLGLVRGNYQLRGLMTTCAPPDADEIRRHAAFATAAFLRVIGGGEKSDGA